MHKWTIIVQITTQIDISSFEKGNYILIVKTIDSGNFINFNVLKK